MLLCGIINELSRTTRLKDPTTSALLSFFFCQATDKRIDNATAVLRGLIYMLLDQQPTLIPHVRRKYDTAGKQLFEDVNAWVALSEIFTTILEDSSLQSTYLIIDALDECQTGRKELLNFISQVASIPSTRVKWIVSSRYGDDIKQGLRLDDVRLQLSLELNADHVSHAVDVYIDHKVSELVSLQDEKALPDQVRVRMRQKANGTFLWVALVFQELQNVDSWNVLQAIDEMPTELVPLYDRMMGQIQQLKHRDPEFCCLVLSKATIAYRPLRLLELGAIAGLPEQISSHPQRLTRLVNKCGSFLTIRDDHVYLVHQSAKDYLSANPTATDAIFPSGPTQSHHSMFSQSLQVMSKTLSRDMYSLHSPGFPIDQVKTPEPDPLAAARYSCVYWVEHLLAGKSHDYDTQDGGIIEEFLSNKYLYWLESLSLLGSMSDGVLSLTKFVAFLQVKRDVFL
jgi:NACHT domain